MNIEICKNDDCKKKFSYTQMGGNMPGTKESEEVRCPYCMTVAFSQRISGVFQSHEMDQDEEE